MIYHVLSCLEIIDKQNFEKVETNNSLDVLYHKLLGSTQASKDGSEVAVVFIICFGTVQCILSCIIRLML